MARLIKLLILLACLLIPASTGAWMSPIICGGGVEEEVGGEAEITDDYSSDTSSDYTGISGGISISGGNAGGSSNWAENTAYHETALSDPDHYAQAEIQQLASSQSSAVLARCNGTTYYAAVLNGTYIKLFKSDLSGSSSADYNGGYASDGTYYTVKMEVSGTGATVNVKVYVDETLRIDYDDSTSPYTAGDYCGVGFRRDSGGNPRLDDLECSAL